MPGLFSCLRGSSSSGSTTVGDLIAGQRNKEKTKQMEGFCLGVKEGRCTDSKDFQGALAGFFELTNSKGDSAAVKNANIKQLADHLAGINKDDFKKPEFKIALQQLVGALKTSHRQGASNAVSELVKFQQSYLKEGVVAVTLSS